MYENIVDVRIAALYAAIAVIAWIVIMQWSKFKKDAKEDRDDDKFAFIPYLLIPIMWGIIAVGLGLSACNWAVGHGYVTAEDNVYLVGAVASLVSYMILDYRIVGLVGDAEHLREIEAKAAKSAESVAKDPKQMTAEEKLALLKEMGLI